MNFSLTVCGGNFFVVLTALKLGITPRMRLVCWASDPSADWIGFGASGSVTFPGTGFDVTAEDGCGVICAAFCAVKRPQPKLSITSTLTHKILVIPVRPKFTTNRKQVGGRMN